MAQDQPPPAETSSAGQKRVISGLEIVSILALVVLALAAWTSSTRLVDFFRQSQAPTLAEVLRQHGVPRLQQHLQSAQDVAAATRTKLLETRTELEQTSAALNELGSREPDLRQLFAAGAPLIPPGAVDDYAAAAMDSAAATGVVAYLENSQPGQTLPPTPAPTTPQLTTQLLDARLRAAQTRARLDALLAEYPSLARYRPDMLRDYAATRVKRDVADRETSALGADLATQDGLVSQLQEQSAIAQRAGEIDFANQSAWFGFWSRTFALLGAVFATTILWLAFRAAVRRLQFGGVQLRLGLVFAVASVVVVLAFVYQTFDVIGLATLALGVLLFVWARRARVRLPLPHFGVRQPSPASVPSEAAVPAQA